ncbi:MAG TPA: hypothetical protein VKY22_16765 [Bradyrhizobium sp.]|nr:hypothetical protein [Bradyrhizobium sp.]
MFAPFPAKRAAVRAARGRAPVNRRLAAALTAAMLLSACVPVTPLAGNDPADPAAKVAAAGYRSTIAPYTSLRPATPARWRERGDGDTPATRPDR